MARRQRQRRSGWTSSASDLTLIARSAGGSISSLPASGIVRASQASRSLCLQKQGSARSHRPTRRIDE
eukprot:6894655-Prymnesium_polylepis.1